MANKPPFLEGNPAATSGGGPCHPPFENRPQKMGSTNQPDGGMGEKFPNRPQPAGSPKGNPQSIPGGGKLPYPGPSKPTPSPMKLGK